MEQLQQLSEWIGSDGRWVISVAMVALVAMTSSFILNRVLARIEAKADATPNPWDDAIVAALRRPARLLIWSTAVWWTLNVSGVLESRPEYQGLGKLFDVIVVFCFSWFAYSLVQEMETRLQDEIYVRKPVDRTTAAAVGKLLRAVVVLTSVVIIMQYLGVNMSGILAVGGVGGIAIGFAAQDLLANFFGALMIYMDRPFKIGDWIRSPDREIEGTVENIGWRITTIRTFDKRPIYVPNSVFSSITVENPSRMTNRRIYETFGVRYCDIHRVADIVAKVRVMLTTHEEIDTNQTLIVNLVSYGDSTVNFFVYTFTKTTDWVLYHEIKQDIMLKVADVIADHGGEFAFPTQTLHLADIDKLSHEASSEHSTS